MEIEITESKIKTSTFKAKCKFCGKIMERPYPEQLRFNMEIHEKTCKMNPNVNKRDKKNEKKSKNGKE